MRGAVRRSGPRAIGGYAQPALRTPVGKKVWSYVSTPVLLLRPLVWPSGRSLIRQATSSSCTNYSEKLADSDTGLNWHRSQTPFSDPEVRPSFLAPCLFVRPPLFPLPSILPYVSTGSHRILISNILFDSHDTRLARVAIYGHAVIG